MHFFSTVVLSALVASVAAQYSPCLDTCINDAVTGTGCSDNRDFQCICSDQDKFGQILSPCLTKCPDSDFVGASQYMKACWAFPFTSDSQTEASTTPGTEPTTGPDAPSTSEPAAQPTSGSGSGSGSGSVPRPSSTGSNSAAPSVTSPGDAAVGVSVGAWGWALAAVAGAAAAL